MYFAVIRINIQKGKTEKEAKKEAFDAITLRFHLSEKTARMLIADYIRTDYDKFKGTFYVQNLRLITTLEEINQEKLEEVERNNRLINLLKEVNNEYSGKNKR
jgi:hypothetical protein